MTTPSDEQQRPIVVGVDGSRDASRAVEWAANLARAEHRPVTLLHAGDGPTEPRVLDDALALAADVAPEVAVRVLPAPDPARHALIDASQEASIVVVGARGGGTLSRLRLGPVTHALARHAASPVVVTRSSGDSRRSGIVAGIDLGSCTRGVLDFAFRIADVRGWPLTVLHCYWDSTGATGDVPEEVVSGLPEQRMVDDAVREHVARHPQVEVRTVLSRGFADRRLLAATLDAGLVVIGHRELPWLESLVYGHVSPVVVEHAVGDVAVVPCAPPQEVWS